MTFLNASLQVLTTNDSTNCMECIGNCAAGDIGSKTFDGYSEDCVNKCICPGAFSDIKVAALTDSCKSITDQKTDPKTDEETESCYSIIMKSTIELGTAHDSTNCMECIGNCVIGD